MRVESKALSTEEKRRGQVQLDASHPSNELRSKRRCDLLQPSIQRDHLSHSCTGQKNQRPKSCWFQINQFPFHRIHPNHHDGLRKDQRSPSQSSSNGRPAQSDAPCETKIRGARGELGEVEGESQLLSSSKVVDWVENGRDETMRWVLDRRKRTVSFELRACDQGKRGRGRSTHA